MKKALFGILIILLVFAASGCMQSKEPVINENDNSNNSMYETFTWPTSDIAKLLPTPKSSVGKIDWEASYGFVIYVAETTKSDYDEYVGLCEEAGFTVDYRKGDDFYFGDNADGYHISLKFDPDGVMFIRADEPEESNKSEDTNQSEKNSTIDSTKVTPEFKKLMDSYEMFFDEYVKFTNKYNNSDAPASFVSELSDYMAKYNDIMSELENINTEELSTADAAYYVEVSERITSKIADIH